MTSERMHALTDMPNIGRKVAGLLACAGIGTPEELTKLGAVAAAIRIRSIRPDDPPCRSMLAGLDGAIRGVRWHMIPKAEREALWTEYEARTSPCTVRRGPRGVGLEWHRNVVPGNRLEIQFISAIRPWGRR